MIGKSSRGQINLPRLGIGVAGSSSLVEASVKLEQALSGLEIRSTGIGVGVAIGSAGGYGDFLGTLSKLKELSRTLEKKLGLKIVSGDRAPDSKTRAADRNEFEEARRLGTDLGHIRNTISDCLHRSNRGTAFKVALTAHGLTLANGDRRDCFVVVDQAGGHHALTKKLTGLTLAEIRQRLCDLDRAQLPGVDQAKAIQNRRHRSRDFSRASSAITETAREAAQTPKRETAPSHPKK